MGCDEDVLLLTRVEEGGGTCSLLLVETFVTVVGAYYFRSESK